LAGVLLFAARRYRKATNVAARAAVPRFSGPKAEL
jgi:hypothetical protein